MPSANPSDDTPSGTPSTGTSGPDNSKSGSDQGAGEGSDGVPVNKDQQASVEKAPSATGDSSPQSPGASSQIIVKPSASAVVIGGSSIPIPDRAAGTTATIDGETYTVQPSRVIGPGTTVAFASGITAAGGSHAYPTPDFETKTVGDATVSIDSTAAVIAGHTYSIGPNAKPTTITAGGQTISIGKNGVGFASTTFPPVHVQATALADSDFYSSVTADGLKMSIDSTAAVIDGKTYKIGPGSSPETTVVDGRTISIGPGGVGMVSTTVNPATMSFPTATSGPGDAGGSPFGSDVTGTGVSGRDGGTPQLVVALVVLIGVCIMI